MNTPKNSSVESSANISKLTLNVVLETLRIVEEGIKEYLIPSNVKVIEEASRIEQQSDYLDMWLHQEVKDISRTRMVEILLGDVTIEQAVQDIEEVAAEKRNQ